MINSIYLVDNSIYWVDNSIHCFSNSILLSCQLDILSLQLDSWLSEKNKFTFINTHIVLLEQSFHSVYGFEKVLTDFFSVGNGNTRWRSAVQQQEYNSAMQKYFVSLNIVHWNIYNIMFNFIRLSIHVTFLLTNLLDFLPRTHH